MGSWHEMSSSFFSVFCIIRYYMECLHLQRLICHTPDCKPKKKIETNKNNENIGDLKLEKHP